MQTNTVTFLMTLCLSVITVGANGQQAELLKDVYPGSNGSYIMHLTTFGQKALFTAFNSQTNNELWITDGTKDGTVLLKEINASTSQGSEFSPFVILNSIAYFTADDGIHGTELWKTDGTAEGTQMVIDLFPGEQSSHPGELIVFQNALYFRAYTPEYGYELFKSSGDAPSTGIVKDMMPGSDSFFPMYLHPAGDQIYFTKSNNTGLYKSNGTETGTGLLREDVIIGELDEAYFTDYKGKLYFRGKDLTGPDSKGTQLWQVSGDEVQRITEIIDEHADLHPNHLTVAGDYLYFIGEQYPYGDELWYYDGSTVLMVKDINTSGHAMITSMVSFEDKLVFSAYTGASGAEPWVSDGTTGGTKILQDINTGAANSSFIDPVIIGDILYFTADNGQGSEIWNFQNLTGSADQFTQVENGAASSRELIKLGDKFIFTASNLTYGDELWMLENTGSGILGNDDFEHRVKIYPNPANDHVYIEITDNTCLLEEISVYNILGQEIYRGKPGDKVYAEISLLDFNPGLYIFQISSGNHIEQQKIMIDRK